MAQVSELSHKLATAEGSNRSYEEEVVRLKQLNQQLSSGKHERDIQLNEAKAKLIALEEKVRMQKLLLHSVSCDASCPLPASFCFRFKRRYRSWSSRTHV